MDNNQVAFTTTGSLLYSSIVRKAIHPNWASKNKKGEPVDTMVVSNPVPQMCTKESKQILEFLQDTENLKILETKTIEIFMLSKWLSSGKSFFTT